MACEMSTIAQRDVLRNRKTRVSSSAMTSADTTLPSITDISPAHSPTPM